MYIIVFFLSLVICLQAASGARDKSLLFGGNSRSGISRHRLVGIVPFHKLGNIKFGLFQDLHLADEAILDREDRGSFSRDIVSNRSRDQFLDQGLEVSLGSKFGHVSDHLSADGSGLGGLGVASSLDLVVLRACERNAEESDDVSVSCSAINIGLNDGLLFADQRAKLVSGHVHTVEVQQTVVSLNILDTKSDLAVGQGFVLVEVGERNFDNTSLKVVGGDLGTLCLGNEGLSTVLDGEDGRSDQFVPFFL
jgi:hypothetical protein